MARVDISAVDIWREGKQEDEGTWDMVGYMVWMVSIERTMDLDTSCWFVQFDGRGATRCNDRRTTTRPHVAIRTVIKRHQLDDRMDGINSRTHIYGIIMDALGFTRDDEYVAEAEAAEGEAYGVFDDKFR